MFLNKEIVTDTHIYGFFGKYRFLSNFHICSVYIKEDGLTYPSSENAYMAQKTDNKLIKELFSKDFVSPKHAKALGTEIKLKEDWDSIRIDSMYKCLHSKFFNNPDLSAMLLSTNNLILEETNGWGDIFWGVCNGVGENNLGKLLMKIREELRGCHD